MFRLVSDFFIFVLSLEFTLGLLNPLPHHSVCYVNNENKIRMLIGRRKLKM